MPLTAEELAELTRHVGYAVLQIQELEETLALHLVLVYEADAKTARRDVETMFVNASKRTLGQLFRDIQKKGKSPSGVLSRLEHFVDERNWLIHRSRRENPGNLRSDARRSQVIARITAMANEALSLMTTFQELTEAHLIARGFDRAKIQARADEIYREWNSTPG
jgi:hypothetical protein